MKMTKLIISGPDETRRILLDPQGITLGRSANCDVILEHSDVSRLHARLYKDPFGRWIVEDLKSHNGILIEGHRVTAQAVLPGQKINIRPFTLSLSEESDRKAAPGLSMQTKISVVDAGPEENIVSHQPGKTSVLSPALMKNLNELTGHLLELSNPSELYSEACTRLARMLDTLVAIVRLPCSSDSSSGPPEILSCHFGGRARSTPLPQAFHLHLSRRVLHAVQTTNVPVMASSRPSSGRARELTVIDEHEPHLVFAARVNESGESIDTLYIDILEKKSTDELFDFIEAAARQIDFTQKNLFLIKDFITKANARIVEQKAGAFEAVIWKALFAVESIHKFTSQCKQLQSELDELKMLETQTLPEAEMESVNENLANLMVQIRSCDAVVDYFVHAYLDSIAKSHEFSKEAIERQFNLIFQSSRLDENYRLSLENQLAVIKKHITLYNNHPDEINFAIIKEDIVTY